MPLHTGRGTPRDVADVAVDAVLSMDGQPTVLQQSAVLAGIASVRQVYDQQVSVGLPKAHVIKITREVEQQYCCEFCQS